MEQRLSVPHFKYCFKKTCNENQVEKEIQHSIAKDKINILFFGNINYNKGIDILIQTINALPQEQAEKLNIIIAGKDFDGTIHKISLMHPQSFQVFLKHINDDELVFLYKNTDYVVLPYRKTSQSGILEISKKSWIFLILSGIATGASWLCYFKALQLGDASKVVPIDKLSIVITLILAFVFLHEQFTVKSIIGSILITAGTLFMVL